MNETGRRTVHEQVLERFVPSVMTSHIHSNAVEHCPPKPIIKRFRGAIEILS